MCRALCRAGDTRAPAAATTSPPVPVWYAPRSGRGLRVIGGRGQTEANGADDTGADSTTGKRCHRVNGPRQDGYPATHRGPLVDRIRSHLPLVRRGAPRRATDSVLHDPLRTSDLADLERLFRVTDTAWTRGGKRPVLAARARIAQLLFPLLGRIEGFQAASTRMHLRHDHDTQILETRVRDVQRIVQDLQRRTGHGAAGPSGAELDPVTTASVRSRLGDLPTLFDAGPVVDLRCGDGALLAALRDRGIEGIGVDDDHAAVLRCRARGHEAWVEPWPAYLAHLRRGSVAGIVVPPSLDDLPGAHRRRVLDAVVRALVPGGRVALETRTGTTRPGDALFQDRWPLPPDVLADALTIIGFADVEVRADDAAADDALVTGRKPA